MLILTEVGFDMYSAKGKVLGEGIKVPELMYILWKFMGSNKTLSCVLVLRLIVFNIETQDKVLLDSMDVHKIYIGSGTFYPFSKHLPLSWLDIKAYLSQD